MKLQYFTFVTLLLAFQASADSTLDAAVGGGLGGAAGAVIGNEVGGREGAIIGGAIGGATGTAIATDKESDKGQVDSKVRVEPTRIRIEHEQSGFCPPGQAKKGRC